MLKKVTALLSIMVFVLSVTALTLAEDKDAKKGRIEGKVVRSNKDKMTLTVRVRDTDAEKTVSYDAATKWTAQEHGAKTVENIDASQVKDGDQVICLGSTDDKGEFHATMVSKRLSHSPKS